jgi:hypothetical protein
MMSCIRKERNNVTYFAVLLNLRELNDDTDRFAGLCLEDIHDNHLVLFVVLNIACFPDSK